MFGESNIGDGGQGHNKAAAMPDDTDEVCGCNGVTKGTISRPSRKRAVHAGRGAQAHQGQRLLRLLHWPGGAADDVHRRGDYSATPKMKAMCGCTDHGHQAVRDAIRIRPPAGPGRVSVPGWKTPNGCASCRPAVNYYLISTWPKEAKDDPQSRFINERSHANIQKDGTYSVMPRMWGGETNAERTAAHCRRGGQVPRSPRSRSPAASASTCWA